MAGSSKATANCATERVRGTVVRFVAAFDAGSARRLNRLIVPASEFRRYTVNGVPGRRTGHGARARSTLLRYFARRHKLSEELTLERFVLSRRFSGNASFRFEVLRAADDLKPAQLYVGRGATTCSGRDRIADWTMRPNPEPPLPTPRNYADSCRLVSSWCISGTHPGSVPEVLRRPLALPTVKPGGSCPATHGQPFTSGQFSGIALGHEPVQPLVPAPGGSRARQGVLVFHPDPVRDDGWYVHKTLWFSSPNYQGPVLIRGRQLDGRHVVAFGESPQLVDPQLPAEPTLNGTGGWREWPGGTWLRTPGCYAWQIDGTDFSQVVVFEAVFAPEH